ncbi:MAG: hypothetical protein ACMVO3_20440 [Thalassobaculum sp.]
MLAVGRALMTNPQPADPGRGDRGACPADPRGDLAGAWQALKSEGQAILVIDKNVSALLSLADRHTVVEKGHVVWEGDTAAFRADGAVIEKYLHV